MASKTLISPTTAVATNDFEKVIGNQIPATLFATNLATTEEVDISISPDAGATFETIFQEGSAVVLSATNNTMTINSPVRIRVAKDATAALSGVFLNYEGQI